MKLPEILKNLTSLINTRLTIEGVFVMKNDTAYIVEAKADIEKLDAAIEVLIPNLKKVLFQKVPAYGGSQYSYCNDIKITGTLCAGQGTEFQCAVSDVLNFAIYMYDEEFIAIP